MSWMSPNQSYRILCLPQLTKNQKAFYVDAILKVTSDFTLKSDL